MTADIKQAPCPTERDQFEAWWESEGQFVRAGGGNYEKTFAYQAWQAARAQAPAPHGPALVQQMLEVMESATSFTSKKARDEHPNVVAAALKWLASHGITGAPS